MTMTYPRIRALGTFGALMLAGCAGAPSTARPAPADIASLEARRAQQPGDPAINLRLAEAYYGAQRYADARAALATTLTQQPGNAEAQVYLGYTYEGLAQFDSARAVYHALSASKTDRNVRRLISGRLALLTRTEMQYYARQAIAQESTVTHTPPPSNTVAVMPFRYTGTDSTYRPLERGLASLVVTDLGRVRNLQLVERERLQALLDELKLSDNGRVDPSTGARSGRLVGAASVVQGQFDVTPTQVRVDASVVRASDAGVAATGSGADQLRALFDIEKQVVFQLIDKLGITLTPAERVAISERPTSNLQAFLLYSRGLEAQDRGDFGAAATAFQDAAKLDPSFGAAATQAQTSQNEQAASTTPPADVATTVGGPPSGPPTQGATLTTAINGTVPTGAGLLTPTGGVTGGPEAKPGGACEGAGCAGAPNATLFTTITITIKRP